MQYYIHSHGFGDDNRRCVALLLKGLRHLAYHPEQDRAVMPQSPPMPADHTRVAGGADFLHRQLPRPLLAPGAGSLPSPIPGGRRPQAGDPNAGQWRWLASGQTVTIDPHVQVQLVSKLGLNEFDYFLFADHRVVQINLHSGQGRWSLFTNRHELSYFQHGYYKPTMPQGDGINDLEQLAKAIGYSKFYLQAEAWDRIKELTSKESLAMLGVFASVWVGSQFTPVGWAADALVLVMTIGGCILLGPHLLEVGSLLASFYKKATNAGRNEAQYRSAGEDFARVVTLLGVDVLMVLVFHVAKAPVNRLVVRVKQGGVGRLPGAKPAEVPVEEPLAEGKPATKPKPEGQKPEETLPTKPTPHKPLTPKQRAELNKKLRDRTITKEEYDRLDWDRRFNNRRSRGVSRYWAEERGRLRRGEKGTREWTPEQREDILKGKVPKHNGEPIEGHHKHNALDHPQAADNPTNIYPATKLEHLKRWHGGDFKNDTKGVPLDPTHPEDF